MILLPKYNKLYTVFVSFSSISSASNVLFLILIPKLHHSYTEICCTIRSVSYSKCYYNDNLSKKQNTIK